MTRVAFTPIGGAHWQGGRNYQLNLLNVLQQQQPGRISALLFVGEDVAETELSAFRDAGTCTVLRDAAFNRRRASQVLRNALLMGRDTLVSAAFARHRVDVVFESAVFFGWRLGQPAIAWMPDFQHRDLPQLFGRVARLKREAGFRAQAAAGRTLMVSSLDSQTACKHYYPGAADRVFAVRFAVPAPAPMATEAARAVADRYCLPVRYFCMPNQYWKHKNHRLVVDAMALARQRFGQTFTVIAPGNPSDPRNPTHWEELQAAVNQAGLQKHFLMPGMIDRADLPPLLQASDALLNPSLMEGWSTTVEEARSAGVPMLLSDLPVHREQAADQAIYFKRDSAQSLAEALHAFEPLSPAQRRSRREAASSDAHRRLARFADDFVAVVEAAQRRTTAS